MKGVNNNKGIATTGKALDREGSVKKKKKESNESSVVSEQKVGLCKDK